MAVPLCTIRFVRRVTGDPKSGAVVKFWCHWIAAFILLVLGYWT